MATADSEGKVTTHGGPGSFTVRAAMVKGEHNYDEAKVRGKLLTAYVCTTLNRLLYEMSLKTCPIIRALSFVN